MKTKKCICGEKLCIGGAEVELGGICHRPNNPCYIIDKQKWYEGTISLPRKPIIVGLWVLVVICLIALLVI